MSSLHWYPGHMHKASKEMAKVLPNVDIIIELLDARIPYSSSNPLIENLRKDKASIKLLSKSDLADESVTLAWQTYFEQQNNTKTLAIDMQQQDRCQKIIDLCYKLMPHKASKEKNITAMVTGIPNVGKSTLINTMAGRAIAKTGNEPAITKGQQRINLKNGIVLLDTPGILWPKVENENSSYRLAATGAIKDTVVTYADVAFYTAEYLIQAYPALLADRYKLTETPTSALALLEKVGAQRGCLRSGGQVDLERVSTIFLHEFRAGTIGAISLETPEMIVKEVAETHRLIAEKEAKKKERLKNHKGRR